jgi:hypothetical protein
MKLSLIINAIKSRCPSFGGRVAGAAEFKPLPEVNKLQLPAAFVIPLDDNAGENKSKTGYWQDITDGFAVVVCMDNRTDERGQSAVSDCVDSTRLSLWKALLGWQPEENYDAIQYDGGALLQMDRAALYYQYEFSAKFEITNKLTRQYQDLSELPDFSGVSVNVDLIDGVTQQPDGEIDFTFDKDAPSS